MLARSRRLCLATHDRLCSLCQGLKCGQSSHRSANKVNILELMLLQIASCCSVLSRNTIVRNSTSVKSVWQHFQLRYSFQATYGHLVDVEASVLIPTRNPKITINIWSVLWETISSQLTITCPKQPNKDEILPVSMEHFIVLTWLD